MCDDAAAPANEGERRRWNDERWTATWTDREALTSSVSPHLLEAADLKCAERVLDIGCGGGWTSIASAEATAPSGVVVGADLSEALLALASKRATEAGVTNVAFRQLDVQTARIEGAPFDVALSQFGVMFFDEPVTAFANVRAHLRRGGRLVFACWQAVEANPWHVGRILAPFVPPPAPHRPGKSPVGPFTLGDPLRTCELLSSAGFVTVDHRAHELWTEAAAGAIADDSQLGFLGVPPDRLDEARAAVAEHLAGFAVEPGRYRFPLAFSVYTALNP